jgi:acyl-CoA synthetase (AMP-forming)/AMP-acid ligase II
MVPGFVENLARGGDRPALLFPNGWAVSYAELARRVERQAQLFGSGRRLVAIEARLSEHAIIAYLAALKRGHAVALLPPDDAETAARFEADFQPACQHRLRDGRWRTEPAKGLPPGDLHPDLALLLSTSGSTGQNRWVRLSARNLEANAAAIAAYLDLQASDRSAWRRAPACSWRAGPSWIPDSSRTCGRAGARTSRACPIPMNCSSGSGFATRIYRICAS